MLPIYLSTYLPIYLFTDLLLNTSYEHNTTIRIDGPGLYDVAYQFSAYLWHGAAPGRGRFFAGLWGLWAVVFGLIDWASGHSFLSAEGLTLSAACQ